MPKEQFNIYVDSLRKSCPKPVATEDEIEAVTTAERQFIAWVRKHHKHSFYGREQRQRALLAQMTELSKIDQAVTEYEALLQNKKQDYDIDLAIHIAGNQVLNSVLPAIREAFRREVKRLDDYLAELGKVEDALLLVDGSIAPFIRKIQAKRALLFQSAEDAGKDIGPNSMIWSRTPAALFAPIFDVRPKIAAENVIPFEGGSAA